MMRAQQLAVARTVTRIQPIRGPSARRLTASGQHALVLRRAFSTPSSPSPSPSPKPPPPPSGQQKPPIGNLLTSLGPAFKQFSITFGSGMRAAAIAAFSIVGLTVAFFEGYQMHIEYVGMPREQVGGGLLDDDMVNDANDPWGWLHDFGEETWIGAKHKGTDPRLGFRARNALRTAWHNYVNGGGIDLSMHRAANPREMPDTLPNMLLGRNATNYLHVEEGTQQAVEFLRSAVYFAEKRGIRLPDMAAIRAGIQPEGQTTAQHTSPNQAVDKTAVMLEYRLASVLERVGKKDALQSALAGYTRLFDALSTLDATNRAMRADGHHSGQPNVRADRLVRLATKVGELHKLLGNPAEAEQWLSEAVSLAGGGAVEEEMQQGIVHARASRQGVFKNEILSGGTGQLARTPAEVQTAQAVAQIERGSLGQSEQHPSLLPTDTLPSPSLTRSLIGSLFALSGLYAVPSNEKALERALQYQAHALRLTRVEAERLALAENSTASDDGAQLYKAWLAYHDGLACMHLGETMYGLHAVRGPSSVAGGLLSYVGLGSNSKKEGEAKQAQTLVWLDEARQRMAVTLSSLVPSDTAASVVASTQTEKDKQSPQALKPQWASAPLEINVQAKRLHRDSLRVLEAVEDMTSILTTGKSLADIRREEEVKEEAKARRKEKRMRLRNRKEMTT